MSGHPITLPLADGVFEEAGIHPGIPHDQRVAVQDAFSGHRRAHHLLGGISDIEEIDPGLDPNLVEHPHQRLHWGVTRPRPEPADTAVNLLSPGPHRFHRVRHTQPEILVRMKPHLGVITELGDQRRHPIGNPVENQRPGGVDHVHALAARIGHDPGLSRQFFRRHCVRHHQKPDRLQPQPAGETEMLRRHIRLGAMGRDPTDRPPVIARLNDVIGGAQPRQHQKRDPGIADRRCGEPNQFLLRGLGKPVIERRAPQTIPVRHLDHRHPRGIEGAHNRHHLIGTELVTLVMAAVAQRGVGDAHVPYGIEKHLTRTGHACCCFRGHVVHLHTFPRCDQPCRDLFPDPGSRRGHDVQIPGVGR